MKCFASVFAESVSRLHQPQCCQPECPPATSGSDVKKLNGQRNPAIYSFFTAVSPGYKIIETPANLVYLPIILDAIYSMESNLTDQNGHLLNLRGENISIRFHVRKI